ncbi:hypothetical protein Q9L42_000245 (plasmid) [Methylomarinum sp. Ch1-1]|uniref:Uncharacterized protein n=1 Tax=Methylomarinum roseum TaxID=3067653 RepID=A0AAU7NP67_9GAMM|nr:hypothetical protein [Methylomarinum sp. Ch1-1]MDP4523071.1 hypothetical protein [Methylomarinum sp. Ch1-1]
MDLLRLGVGQRFDHDMPAEGMSIMLASGSPLLTFNFSLTEKQIAAFLNGSTSFGLAYEHDVLFFLFKIDGFLDWSDLAFTIHLAGDEAIEDNSSYLPFHLLLVDSATSIIQGIRIVTASPDFRRLLARATVEQAEKPFDTIAYYRTIGELYKTYPTAHSMLKKARLMERGGLTLPDDRD